MNFLGSRLRQIQTDGRTDGRTDITTCRNMRERERERETKTGNRIEKQADWFYSYISAASLMLSRIVCKSQTHAREVAMKQTLANISRICNFQSDWWLISSLPTDLCKLLGLNG